VSTMDEGPPGPGESSERDDYPLTYDDVELLMRELARTFNTEDRVMLLLRSLRFPRELIPEWGNGGSLNFWSLIFNDLDNGVVAAPYRRLIAAALRIYAQNQQFASLERRYQETAEQAAESAPAAPPPEQEAQLACHLVAWTESDDERAALENWLGQQGLDPRPEWITPTSVSFLVNQADPHAVDRVMSAQRGINWTVVAPGVPDYVLRYMSVQGPDGRSFRFNDVPSATPVSSVASELVDQYNEGLPGADQPTVVEHVGPDGPRRMNPDSTLAEEGVPEGARLRVGFERRAAAVNPLDRRSALFRARNQLLEYAELNAGFLVTPNSPALPTEYDIEFTQPSFGPPPGADEQPPGIRVHQLSIVLLPDFPIVAPQVRWLSDVFHPNIWPTYESEPLREKPYARGLVCLGTLAESYQPGLDFGELCATLVDIAGYRNYSVAILAKDVVDATTGRPVLRDDYYDGDAARWACSPEGQERIIQIDGAPVLRAFTGRPARLGLEVEPDVTEPDGTGPDVTRLDA